VRVAIVDTYYPAFLEEHYAARPGLDGEPYEVQLRSLLDRSFGTSDAYSRGLRALGHEATDLIVNCAPLQRAWPGRRRFGRRRRVAMDQIAALDPEVVYFQDLNVLGRRDLNALRDAGRLVVGQIASPAPPDEQLRGYDLILTSFPHFVERFRALGLDSEYFRIAFDPEVLERLGTLGGRTHDVVFVGGIHPGVHGRGTALLEEVCARLDVDVWGYGADALPEDSPILRRYHGEAWGLDMYAVLAQAKVCLNRHIDAAEGHANNMRLYEATGMGAALLTDRGSNLAELFEPEREVATYEGADELVAQAQRLLSDEPARAELARAGHARTMREHTYPQRMAELAAILEARLG
jgi:spore maturation protein CgeB